MTNLSSGCSAACCLLGSLRLNNHGFTALPRNAASLEDHIHMVLFPLAFSIKVFEVSCFIVNIFYCVSVQNKLSVEQEKRGDE